MRLATFENLELPFVKVHLRIHLKMTDDDDKALMCFPNEYVEVEVLALWDTGATMTCICHDVVGSTETDITKRFRALAQVS